MKSLLVALFVLTVALPAPAGDDTLDLYDIRDLVKSENRPGDEIATYVRENVDGITKIEFREGGILCVNGPAAVQGKVREFLNGMREASRDVLQVFPIEDLVTRGHAPEDLAKRMRKLSPDAKVMLHQASRLIVAAPPRDLVKIAGALSELRRRPQPLVTIETRFLRGGEPVDGTRFLTEKGLDELLRMIEKSGVVSITNAPKITTYNGQRASLTIGSKRSYVKDFTIHFGKDDATLIDPVVDTIFEGLDVAVRPIVSADRKHVTLVIDARARKLLEPDPVSGVGKKAGVGMDLLEVREIRRLTSITLPAGGTVILDLGTIPVDGKEQAVQLLLRATVTILDDRK